MVATLQLIAILGLGYLGTHFFAERVRARFHVVTGIEFVVLGVLVGPHVTHVMTPEVLGQLGPVISLAIGAVGLVLGLDFRFARLLSTKREALELSFYGVVTTTLVVGGLAMALVWMTLPTGARMSALPSALALGAIAAVSAPGPIRTVHRSMDGQTRLALLLESSTGFDQLLATLLFGLVFCLFHIGLTAGLRPLTATEWIAVSVGFGVVLGFLFYLFLGRERDPDRLLLALIGIVLFSSGSAYYLNLSPLFVNLVLGAMLANTSRHATELREVMGSMERPLTVVILVVAGASWNLPAMGSPLALGFLAICLLGRPVGKALGGLMSFRYGEPSPYLTPGMGMGTLAHGGLAVAMAVNFRQVYAGAAADGVFSAVLVSVLVWEVLAPARIRRALIDSEPSLAPRTAAPAP
ncbi:MAG: cation:proton antiporter [Longimicrobiales bacterium]